MTIKQLLRHTILVSAACLSCSCVREAAEEPERCPASFCIDTRALAADVTTGTTYRIMAYNPSNLAFVKAGTYMLASLPAEGGVAELTPCALDDDGNVVEGGEPAMFDGTVGTYSLVFVSPGIKGNDDGSFDIDLTELGSAEGCGFVMSELPESKFIGHYGRIVMAHPMKQCRARIGIDFYKARGVADFEVTDLRITGAGTTGAPVRFFPAKRQVRVNPDNGIAVKLTKETAGQVDGKGNALRFTTAESDRQVIVPAIYAPREVVKELLKISSSSVLEEGSYIVMHCSLTQQGRDPVTVTLPLTMEWPEVSPQKNYIYRVVVSDNYINLAVDVYGDESNDWEERNPVEGGGTIGGPGQTIELGSWEIVSSADGNGWELKNLEGQTIGGETPPDAT